MEKLGNIIKQPAIPAGPKKGGVNSPFNNAIAQVCDLMNDNRFAYWCGRLRRLSAQEIHAMVSIARHDGKKPAAYFNYLVKKKLAELSTHKVDNKTKGV